MQCVSSSSASLRMHRVPVMAYAARQASCQPSRIVQAAAALQESKRLSSSALLAGLAAVQLTLLPGAAFAEEAAPAPATEPKIETAAPTAPKPTAVVAEAPPVKAEQAPAPAATVASAPSEPATAKAAPAPAASPEAPKPAAVVAQAPEVKPEAKPEALKPSAVVAAASSAAAAAAAEAAAAPSAKAAQVPDEVAVTADAPEDVMQFSFSFKCSVEVKDIKAGAEPVVLAPKCTAVPAS